MRFASVLQRRVASLNETEGCGECKCQGAEFSGW